MSIELNIDISTRFVVTECAQCGIKFAVPELFDKARRDEKGNFYCPNGHSLAYRESKADRLQKELMQERAKLDQARADASHWKTQTESARRSAIATRGALTRARRRVGNGVCPCCGQGFPDLRRHMNEHHPDYKFLVKAPK